MRIGTLARMRLRKSRRQVGDAPRSAMGLPGLPSPSLLECRVRRPYQRFSDVDEPDLFGFVTAPKGKCKHVKPRCSPLSMLRHAFLRIESITPVVNDGRV
jgi:hypothetical protein